ncbi:MAG: SIS domain-containing protein, partial [Candidatus Aminicenantes bacterium]|nr:SIS domain-containing protein [Candidatus Aminicenantes bacterium]
MSEKSSGEPWPDMIDMRIAQYSYFKDHNERILEAAALMEQAVKQGHKILVFGNGGSATQAAHFAAELVNKFYFQRKALP